MTLEEWEARKARGAAGHESQSHFHGAAPPPALVTSHAGFGGGHTGYGVSHPGRTGGGSSGGRVLSADEELAIQLQRQFDQEALQVRELSPGRLCD